jgi:hypothetical protein
MPMGITREVKLSPPCTLNDLDAFVQAAHEMGCDRQAVLQFSITPGYSDPRESSPGSFTLTARP